jgi:hypothetical protein
MAALTDGDWTSLTEVNDIVPTEYIQSAIEGFNLPLNIGNLLVSSVPGQGYITHQFARWDEPTLPDPVRAGGATDTVLYMDFATSSSTITPVLKGIGFLVPDELLSSTVAGQGVPLNLLELAMRKIMEYKDLDILDSVQAATNTVGTSATVPSFAQFRTYLHAFKLLENDGQPVFVANAYFWELLLNEFSTATSQLSARIVTDVMMSGAKSAYHGTLMGFDMWESHNIATEAGAANNFMMTVGPGANRTIGQVNQRGISVERTRGDTYAPRFTTQYVVGWADGTALLRADGLQECLADAAA